MSIFWSYESHAVIFKVPEALFFKSDPRARISGDLHLVTVFKIAVKINLSFLCSFGQCDLEITQVGE